MKKLKVEWFGIVGKKMEGKDELRREGYLALDLEDAGLIDPRIYHGEAEAIGSLVIFKCSLVILDGMLSCADGLGDYNDCPL